MTNRTPIANLPYPEDDEFVDAEQIGALGEASEIMLVVPFVNVADRTAKWPTPPVGALCYLLDSNKYQSFVGGSWVDLGSLHSHSQYVVHPPVGNDGVKKLFRSDEDSAYHVRSDFDGARWNLTGRNPDGTFHGAVRVGYADYAADAAHAAGADNVRGWVFNWADRGGVPNYILGGNDPSDIHLTHTGEMTVAASNTVNGLRMQTAKWNFNVGAGFAGGTFTWTFAWAFGGAPAVVAMAQARQGRSMVCYRGDAAHSASSVNVTVLPNSALPSADSIPVDIIAIGP